MIKNKKIYDVITILLSVLLVAISATNVFATEATSEENTVNDVNNINTEETLVNETNTTKENETNIDKLNTNLKAESNNEPAEITFTDFSKVTFNIKRDTTGNSIDYSSVLEIKNLDFREDNRDYYVFITNGDEEPPIKYKESGWLDTESLSSTKQYSMLYSNNELKTSHLNYKLAHAGDLYITIVEYYRGDAPEGTTVRQRHKIVVDKRKLNRPAQLPLTKRFSTYFFEDSTRIYNWEITHADLDNKFNYRVKIGRVTDKEVLESIKNKESDSLQKLMKYAKESPSIYSSTLKPIDSTNVNIKESIFKDINITSGEYYYGYISLDTDNGTYYPIEDIMLYTGLIVEATGDRVLIDYLDDRFTWNLKEPEKPTNNIKVNKVTDPVKNDTPTSITGNLDNTKASGSIPQTGNLDWITIGILAVIGTAFGVGYYKSKKYSDIK